MKYGGCLFAVKDINAARKYYEELFGIQVVTDYGICLGFDCGITLQQDFDRMISIDKNTMAYKEHNCELFFEEEDFDGFVQKLKARPDADLLREVETCSWGQRVIHFYDPDGHLLEVGEPISSVAKRFLDSGMTKEQVAVRMDVSTEELDKILK